VIPLASFLQKCGLSEHLAKFTQEGYESIDILRSFDRNELLDILTDDLVMASEDVTKILTEMSML